MKIICRCEDITEEEIVRAIREYGCETLDELKHVLRLGMGQCQGRTCLPLAARILARETGRDIRDIEPQRFRSPVVPVPVWVVEDDEG